MEGVYVQLNKEAKYPTQSYSPSKAYPEYRFSDYSEETNDAYDMVREVFIGAGLDSNHAELETWNPLGGYIKPGQTVLIKPNWVKHENGRGASVDFMNCLVTHPSVIRAVCDYVLIALENRGRVIIGDAPIQSCDLDLLFQKMGYGSIFEYYEANGIDIVSPYDFRAYRTVFNSCGVATSKEEKSSGVDVDLGSLSMQRELRHGEYFQVSDYERTITTECHTDGRHVYSISQIALQADVVINMPKPKCHRLAGITGAMKNLVGIANRKETLPHRRSGSAVEGGDAYMKPSIVKRAADYGLDMKAKCESKGNTLVAGINWLWSGGLRYFTSKFYKDRTFLGSWPGNDTIWRTVMDLNYAFKYADKDGKIQAIPQRTMLCVADMIVAGQKDGPISPSPKHVGGVVFGEEFSEVDYTICKLMGFDPMKIPLLHAIYGPEGDRAGKYPIVDSNIKDLRGSAEHIRISADMKFAPHSDWASALGE